MKIVILFWILIPIPTGMYDDHTNMHIEFEMIFLTVFEVKFVVVKTLLILEMVGKMAANDIRKVEMACQ